MIEVRNLVKDYGNFRAIDNISFEVKEGEIMGFLGPNGAGKTTTMRILSGYMKATDGQARIAGLDVFDNPLKTKRFTGYLPESTPLYSYMRVTDFLDFMASFNGLADRPARKKRVEYAVERCGLKEIRNRIIGHLSKGNRQRVGIAQALVHNPKVLILDEPTIGLDPNQIINIRNTIRDLKNEHTIILSSHILSEVSMTCDRALIIDRGSVVAMDTPDKLSTQMEGDNLLAFIRCSGKEEAVMEALKTVKGVDKVDREKDGYLVNIKADQGNLEDLPRLIIARNWDLREFSPQRLSLEDVFIKLTGSETEEDNR
ncbi:MAG: ATP-binding cassette domain-containing protein [bacterium]